MKSAQRTCVIVAGMHRSGTSALTRVLNLLGCDLPKQVIGADANNQTGYWEPVSINTLNDQLLESAGSTWDDCTPCTPGWFQSPRADEFRERCGLLFDEEYGSSRLTVLKEPRICRLLPFWLDVIENKGIEPLIILPIRNPLAVADSLSKRDFSDPLYNYHLWLRHVLDAEKGSRGKKRFFCGYDDLIDSWSSVISRSQEVLSFKWPRLSAKASDEIDNYIASRHRHHTYTHSNVLNDSSLPSWLRATYRIMRSWVENGENPNDYEELDEISKSFDQACTAFARLLYRGKTAQLELHQMHATLAQRDQALSDLNHQVSALTLELDGARATIGEIIESRDTHAHRLNELEATHQAIVDQSASVSHERQLLEEKCGDLEHRLAQVQSEYDTLAAASVQNEALLNEAFTARAAVQEQFEALQAQASARDLAFQHELNDRVTQLTAQAEADHEAQRAFVLGLETKITDLESSLLATQNEKKLFDEIERDLRAKIDVLSTEVDAATRAKEALEVKAQDEAEVFKTNIATILAERDALMAQLSERSIELQKSHQQSSDLIQTLEMELTQANKVVEGLKQHVHLLLADVESNNAELETEKANQTALWRIIDQVQADLSAAEAREKLMQEKLDSLIGDMTQKISELRQRQAETDDLNREVQAARKALEAEQLKSQNLSMERASTIAQMNARISQLEHDLAQREHEMALTTAALEALQTSFARQAAEHEDALREKEKSTLAVVNASMQTTEKLRGQVNALVRGLADEKHRYFIRKSAAIQRKAALLVESGVLDVDWYLSTNTDVAASGVDAGVHYLTAGLAEGRALSSS